MATKRKPLSQLSKSGRNFRKNPASAKKKDAISKKVNARPEQVKKRVESNRARRKATAAGKSIKGKDFDHATGTFVKSEKNRGRAGEGGRKKKKSKK